MHTGCALSSEQNLSRTSKSTEDIETYGQIGLNSNFEMSNNKDHQSLSRSSKSLKNNINTTTEPSTNGINYCNSHISNLESNERFNTSAYCGWSTNDDMMASSDIYSTSTFNCTSQTSGLSLSLRDTHVTSNLKGILWIVSLC